MVNCGNPIAIQLADAQTVEFWFKGTGFTGDWQQIIWKRHGSPEEGWQIFLHSNANTLTCTRWLAGVGINTGYIAYTLNICEHWVWSYDGANQNLYKNGFIVAGPIADTRSISVNADLYLSKDWDPVSATISMVALYSNALTPQEITEHYLAGKELFG